MLLPNAGAVTLLRERTARAHAALETSDLVMPSTLDRTRYAGLIGAMLSFHTAIEREFTRFEDQLSYRGVRMHDRYKAALLSEESTHLASPSFDEPNLRFDSVAQAAGGVYVMEGSTLGGTLIAKSVLAHLEVVSRYYGCYGESTARRWRATSEELNGFARHSDDIDAMIAGANLTFSTLHRHLEESLTAVSR